MYDATCDVAVFLYSIFYDLLLFDLSLINFE